MQYDFMNLSQAQEDMEKLKQAAGVVEQALDDGFGAGLREIVEKIRISVRMKPRASCRCPITGTGPLAGQQP